VNRPDLDVIEARRLYEQALRTWAQRNGMALEIPEDANGVLYLENCVGGLHGPTVFLRWSPSNVDRPGAGITAERQWRVDDKFTLHTILAEIIAIVLASTSPQSTHQPDGSPISVDGGEQS
jgi:hypothetical protein